MTNTEYKNRVINHFKQKVALNDPSDNDWQLLSELFFAASESGEIEEFDKRILTSTEFEDLYLNDEY